SQRLIPHETRSDLQSSRRHWEINSGWEAVANDVAIRLLGAAAAWRGEDRLTFKTRKALAVLAYLAAARPQRRHDLAAMFWPGRDPDRARASLRTTLGYLRRTLGDAAGASLETTRHTVGLTPSSSLTIDIKTLDWAAPGNSDGVGAGPGQAARASRC